MINMNNDIINDIIQNSSGKERVLPENFSAYLDIENCRVYEPKRNITSSIGDITPQDMCDYMLGMLNEKPNISTEEYCRVITNYVESIIYSGSNESVVADGMKEIYDAEVKSIGAEKLCNANEKVAFDPLKPVSIYPIKGFNIADVMVLKGNLVNFGDETEPNYVVVDTNNILKDRADNQGFIMSSILKSTSVRLLIPDQITSEQLGIKYFDNSYIISPDSFKRDKGEYDLIFNVIQSESNEL